MEDNEDNAGGNYGKISTAIANMQKSGITIALPEIDTAEYGFVPDETNNQIIFSLKAISGVGDDVARSIIQNRPFSSMQDFYERMVDTKIITPVKMQQLIKAGCFTVLDNPDRKQTMRYYLEHYQANVVDKLTMVHVENMRRMGLIRNPLMERYARVPAFVKYVTQNCRVMDLITDNGTKRKLPKKGYFDRTLKLDNVATTFFLQVYTMDSVVGVNGVDYMISEQKFIKESEKYQTQLREWMNRPEIIQAYNESIFNEQYGELMSQSVSEWEMNSVGYYYSGHELANVQNELYGIEDYFSMPEEPVAYDHYSRWINGERKWLPKFKISRIAGTVVDSNNDKHTVTLLTVNGIVNVKLDKGRYVHYNQKLSTVDEATGKKTKVEDSWFTRGTKIVVCGYRKGFNFRAYKYADTIYTHIISKITKVNADGTLELKVERGLNEDL